MLSQFDAFFSSWHRGRWTSVVVSGSLGLAETGGSTLHQVQPHAPPSAENELALGDDACALEGRDQESVIRLFILTVHLGGV